MQIFPEGTMTKFGAGGSVAVTLIALVLNRLGIGECTPDVVAVMPNCLGATEIAGGLLVIVLGIVAWIGRNRAESRHKAELAAALGAAAPPTS